MQLSAVIGPGNIVGYNRGSDGVALTDPNSEFGGIAVTGGNSDHVRIWGNIVGLSRPDGSAVDIGKAADGITIVGTDHEVGGETLVEGNIVGSNGRHGIVVRGCSGTVRNRVRGNSIVTLPPPLEGADQGNDGYGLWLLSGGNLIGGDGDTKKNVIAFNGSHGARTTTSFSWSNLPRKNSIYGVPAGSLGIDLDVVENAADPTDDSFGGDRVQTARNHAQWQQNTVVLGTAGYAPPRRRREFGRLVAAVRRQRPVPHRVLHERRRQFRRQDLPRRNRRNDECIGPGQPIQRNDHDQCVDTGDAAAVSGGLSCTVGFTDSNVRRR